jgi:mannitol-1-phosphate 5-dehydrogenase
VSRVLIVGPGRIGCGYLAPLFHAAGWEVVLGAPTEDTAARIRRADGFRVRITTAPPAGSNGSGAHQRAFEVRGVTAVAVGSEAFEHAVAGADLVCASVGVANATSIAASLARGLARRAPDRRLDVWSVENGNCAPELEARVRDVAAAEGSSLPPVGFAGAIAEPAVAHGDWRQAERPEFVGDDARVLYVDARPLTTPLPNLPGIVPIRDYEGRLREKLYVFNGGHTICAYLGWLRGHATIAEAVADPLLRPLVVGSLLESRRALLALHPELGDDLHGPVAEALRRYADPALQDPVVRVARNPLRKLRRHDRLIGPAELIRRATGRLPVYFALGAAGALLYRGDDDPETTQLASRLAAEGVMAVLRSVCGLARDDELADAIATRYCGFIVTPEETLFPPVHVPLAVFQASARANPRLAAR